jgi:hypothetical protein
MLKRNCQFCGEPATYDFAAVGGHWAYGCDNCRRIHGLSPKDGVGTATKLDGSTTKRDIPDEIRQIAIEMGFDGGDDEIAAMMEVSGYND